MGRTTCLFCKSGKINVLAHKDAWFKQAQKIEDLQFTEEGPDIELLFWYITGLVDHINHLEERISALEAAPPKVSNVGGDGP